MNTRVRGLEPLQMLTMQTVDGRTISGIYTRAEASTRAAWALLQPDYKSHILVDWHCAWCDPRDKEPRACRPLTSGICQSCSEKQ